MLGGCNSTLDCNALFLGWTVGCGETWPGLRYSSQTLQAECKVLGKLAVV